MRNKVAKIIKKTVAVALYVGDDVTLTDIKKDKHSVYGNEEFKSMYRARKKKHNNPHHSTNVISHPSKPGVKFTGKYKLSQRKVDKGQ